MDDLSTAKPTGETIYGSDVIADALRERQRR